MTPAPLIVAVSVQLSGLPPTPWEIDRAGCLIRHPELDSGPVGRRESAALLAAGRRLGLLGPEERIGYDGEFGYDVEPDGDTVLVVLRGLWTELKAAPPLADLHLLPPCTACYEASNFCLGLAAGWRLRAMWEPDRAEVFERAAEVADCYAAFWSTAGYAQSEGPGVGDRRRSLAQLRDTIGADAWAAGVLPDLAPSHLLRSR